MICIYHFTYNFYSVTKYYILIAKNNNNWKLHWRVESSPLLTIPLVGRINVHSWSSSKQIFFCVHLVHNFKFQIQIEREDLKWKINCPLLSILTFDNHLYKCVFLLTVISVMFIFIHLFISLYCIQLLPPSWRMSDFCWLILFSLFPIPTVPHFKL